ncbi:hypothetical protein AMTRI_Chr03g149120 [Amborella trichopoda]
MATPQQNQHPNPNSQSRSPEPSAPVNQRTGQIAPLDAERNLPDRQLQSDWPHYTNRITLLFFLLHLLVAFVLTFYLAVRSIIAASSSGFQLLNWYPQLLTTAAASVIFSYPWLILTLRRPLIAIKACLSLAPFLTSAFAFILLGSSTVAGGVLGGIALFAAICMSLYGCYVAPRIDFASLIIGKSLSSAEPHAGKLVSPANPYIGISILVGILWSVFWVTGLVGGASMKHSALYLLALCVSYYWTMGALRAASVVALSRVSGIYFARGNEVGAREAFIWAHTKWFGSACLGALSEPFVCVMRLIARVANAVEQEDEFLFSCAHCCLGVTARVRTRASVWGYTHIGMHGKGFVQASEDTWVAIDARGMGPTVEGEMAGAVWWLAGVASGAGCAVLVGGWTLGVDKEIVPAVAVFAFFTGYSMTRIALALPQACVCSYYVAFLENPESPVFDETIPDRIKLFQPSFRV